MSFLLIYVQFPRVQLCKIFCHEKFKVFIILIVKREKLFYIFNMLLCSAYFMNPSNSSLWRTVRSVAKL